MQGTLQLNFWKWFEGGGGVQENFGMAGEWVPLQKAVSEIRNTGILYSLTGWCSAINTWPDLNRKNRQNM